VKGSNFGYAGGIVGYNENIHLFTCINAGIVEGAIVSVGGIAGGVGSQGKVFGCINTNKVDNLNASYFGAIVGENTGFIDTCYFDEQTSFIGDLHPNCFGLPTRDMLGFNLLTPINYYS